MNLIPFGSDPFPKIDIKETAAEVIVTADVPNIDPKKILVEVGEDFIRLSVSSKQEKEEKGRGFYRKEHSSQSFERIVRLPCAVLSDNVKAGTKDGILTVVLSKKHPLETVKMKKIPVEEE